MDSAKALWTSLPIWAVVTVAAVLPRAMSAVRWPAAKTFWTAASMALASAALQLTMG